MKEITIIASYLVVVFWLCVAWLGLYLIGKGLCMMYEPLAYIYGGIVAAWIGGVGSNKALEKMRVEE